MWKVFYSIIFFFSIHHVIGQQGIVKPNFKLKEVTVIKNPKKEKTFMNYSSFEAKEEIDHNVTKEENKKLLEELRKNNKLLNKYFSRDKKAREVASKKEEEISFSMPLETIYITSDYGFRKHPILNKNRFHYGVDIRANYEPVKSILNGIVIEAKRGMGKGRYICIKSQDIEFRYYHLDEIHVRKGQKVQAGEIIGKTGNTGLSKAPHLHLETLINNKHINPNTLLKKLNNLKNQK